MKNMMLMATLVASLAFARAAEAGTTQFVTNGDFSSLSNGLGQMNYPGDTVATGWSTTGYNFVMNVADISAPGQYAGGLTLWDKANGGNSTWNGESLKGNNYVAMDGAYENAPIEQTITGLTSGQKYTLSFDYAFAQQYTYNQDTNQTIAASFGGKSVFTSALTALPEHGFSGWKTYTGTVTATDTSEVLSFLAYGDKTVPPFALLTDVSMTSALPESATWVTMILGLGIMGAGIRRRRLAAIA